MSLVLHHAKRRLFNSSVVSFTSQASIPPTTFSIVTNVCSGKHENVSGGVLVSPSNLEQRLPLWLSTRRTLQTSTRSFQGRPQGSLVDEWTQCSLEGRGRRAVFSVINGTTRRQYGSGNGEPENGRHNRTKRTTVAPDIHAGADQVRSDDDASSEQSLDEELENAGVSASELVEELKKVNAELLAQFTEAEQKCTSLQDRLLRALADGENTRQRYTKEVELAKQFGISKFAEAILEVADNLSLAVEHGQGDRRTELDQLLEGVKLTQSALANIFSNFGVASYDPIGEAFNPSIHEALFEMHHAKVPKGAIAQVMKKGYTIHGRVLRPAKVGTSKGPAP